MYSISNLGWSSFFERQLVSSELKIDQVVRIIDEQRQMWRVAYLLEGKLRESWAVPSGRLRFNSESGDIWPAIGDFCVARLPFPSDENDIVSLEEVLTRKSTVVRQRPGSENPQVVAANIDFAVVVTSMNEEFNPRRLERFLVSIWNGGVTPILVLSKADLTEDHEPFLRETEKCAQGAKVLVVSTRTGQGLKELSDLLVPHATSVFLGSSGVGKSSLVNALLNKNLQRVNDVRAFDTKGRHTTTSRTLFFLPNGSLIIDTPGVREFALYENAGGIQKSFVDVESLTLKCKFSNCTHQNEKGCAVKEALTSGALSEERLKSYEKLQREASFIRRRDDKKEQAEYRKKIKKINIAHRQRKKFEKDE